MQLASSSYEHIDPALVGNERRILVSELSGRSNIAAMTKGKDITDPEVNKRVLANVVHLENMGYQFEAAEASFDLLVQKAMGMFTPHFERIKYNVDVETSGPCVHGGHDAMGELTEATVKITLPDGSVRHEVAEGDGPVGALDAALRKSLDDFYPTLRDLHLVDYKVRVVNGAEAGTGAVIRVIVESSDKHTGDLFSTIGVSTNIIEASWLALNDAVEYKLQRDAARAKAKSREVASKDFVISAAINASRQQCKSRGREVHTQSAVPGVPRR